MPLELWTCNTDMLYTVSSVRKASREIILRNIFSDYLVDGLLLEKLTFGVEDCIQKYS